MDVEHGVDEGSSGLKGFLLVAGAFRAA